MLASTNNELSERGEPGEAQKDHQNMSWRGRPALTRAPGRTSLSSGVGTGSIEPDEISRILWNLLCTGVVGEPGVLRVWLRPIVCYFSPHLSLSLLNGTGRS